MTDEIDYKALYEEMKTKYDAIESGFKKELETLKTEMSAKDTKIGELQTYICKNLTTENPPKENASLSSFEDRYKNAIKNNTKQ